MLHWLTDNWSDDDIAWVVLIGSPLLAGILLAILR